MEVGVITEISRDLSRGMVALLKRYLGRGPKHARTYLDEDLVVIVLKDTMTQAERTLVAEQQVAEVKRLRRVFQGAFRDDAVELVERVTGRRVVAFLSDHAIHPDYAVEVFVLEPNGADGADGADGASAPVGATEGGAAPEAEDDESTENPAAPGDGPPTG